MGFCEWMRSCGGLAYPMMIDKFAFMVGAGFGWAGWSVYLAVCCYIPWQLAIVGIVLGCALGVVSILGAIKECRIAKSKRG